MLTNDRIQTILARLRARAAVALLACIAALAAVACEPTDEPVGLSNPPASSTFEGIGEEIEPPAPEPAETEDVRVARVTRVVDGDTIAVRFGDGETDRVRLIGVDAPESGRRWFAEASAFTSQWVSGSRVFLEQDVEARDDHGRLLAYVWLKRPPSAPTRAQILDRMVNAKLVFQGFAKAITVAPNDLYENHFLALQSQAKAAGRRIWTPKPKPAPKPAAPTRNCHPSYSGACLDPNASDYDCAGGSGDGPKYVDGPVYVEGSDPYRLDSDNDGVGCES